MAAPTPAPADPGPTSVWGKKTDFEVPPVKVGTTKPVPGEAEAAPTNEQAAWRAEQRERARTGEIPKSAATSARSAEADAAAAVYVPEDQGAVPWHQISDFRITDALVARINLSTGNLMLAATDFEIAGVGQKLRLARTYNSFDAPWGKVSQRWWQEYERGRPVAAHGLRRKDKGMDITTLAADGKEPVTGPLLYFLIGVAVLFAVIIAVRLLRKR
ncbi:DUF6531 domain-containing protein [Streptomyces paradoxus]|uniref:DUF6531 domain-containing protein n=1 Tax=Streptomyces paradoxus TaxID=66375 RepID=A0A7W9T8P7_9ACTN|nr:hypothetical protein [Streptomyces paradoxus]